MKLSKLLLILILTAVSLNAQQLIKMDKISGGLEKQFEQAFEKGKSSDNFWIAYGITRNDSREIMVGSFYYNDDNPFTLRDFITNPEKMVSYNSLTSSLKKYKRYGRSFRIDHSVSIDDNKGDKVTAILFLYDKNSESPKDFVDLGICSLSKFFDLGGYPLIWLGNSENQTSLDFLFDLYKKENNLQSRKELLPAIGVHTGETSSTGFLKNILDKKNDHGLREDAVFWMGFQNNTDAFSILKNLINGKEEFEIRKRAVQSLGFINVNGALEELINIARRNSDRELRKQAVYGLSNKAVKNAEDALKGIIENDPDIEIKKHAVYALANESDKNIPYLIKIAKTNASLPVRKSAIWSLGNSDDPRAVDALIDLAKH